MLTEFGRVFIFLLVGVVFVAGGMIFAWLLRPNRPYPSKLSTYECGELPVGDTRVRFNVRFYVVALIFLIFDVEVVFLGILVVGYAYVWAKGDLDWDKPAPKIPRYTKGIGVQETHLKDEDIAV